MMDPLSEIESDGVETALNLDVENLHSPTTSTTTANLQLQVREECVGVKISLDDLGVVISNGHNRSCVDIARIARSLCVSSHAGDVGADGVAPGAVLLSKVCVFLVFPVACRCRVLMNAAVFLLPVCHSDGQPRPRRAGDGDDTRGRHVRPHGTQRRGQDDTSGHHQQAQNRGQATWKGARHKHTREQKLAANKATFPSFIACLLVGFVFSHGDTLWFICITFVRVRCTSTEPSPPRRR
jgi:hypothetical protein